MKDTMWLGPVPPEERCAQLGEGGYEERAETECRRYIQLIRKVKGPEPPGAKLLVKWQAHDLGSYCEVVCQYETDDAAALDYALEVESDGPISWDDDEDRSKKLP